jgi:hypothetical protein
MVQTKAHIGYGLSSYGVIILDLFILNLEKSSTLKMA